MTLNTADVVSSEPTGKFAIPVDIWRKDIIKKGKPPALPERLPEFDNSGNIRKSPIM